jgi:prepilin-type processing-associated H-X9-DG protein/prepilin-type N-terminal cleavage/methylation domain-containing protein
MEPRKFSISRAFTLIELLVSVAIIALLIGILLPSLSAARRQGIATKCRANLHVLGHGLVLYSNDHGDAMVPSRLPKWQGDDCNPWAAIHGRRKFRPTFVAMMSLGVGLPPFEDPQACRNTYDKFGEKGDRQNYSYGTYVCPAVPEWTDERNGSYGYNYHFLGNSRLRDENGPKSAYKNWPVQLSSIRYPGSTVAVADGMGTAAHFAPWERLEYSNNAASDDPYTVRRLGNEGFNLDPPRVNPDEENGEMADIPHARSAADPRHSGRTNVLWVDGHVSCETLEQLGYEINPNGSVALGDDLENSTANNSKWTGNGKDLPWTFDWEP